MHIFFIEHLDKYHSGEDTFLTDFCNGLISLGQGQVCSHTRGGEPTDMRPHLPGTGSGLFSYQGWGTYGHAAASP